MIYFVLVDCFATMCIFGVAKVAANLDKISEL